MSHEWIQRNIDEIRDILIERGERYGEAFRKGDDPITRNYYLLLTKFYRLEELEKQGKMYSIRDTLIDICGYSIILLELTTEEKGKDSKTPTAPDTEIVQYE